MNASSPAHAGRVLALLGLAAILGCSSESPLTPGVGAPKYTGSNPPPRLRVAGGTHVTPLSGGVQLVDGDNQGNQSGGISGSGQKTWHEVARQNVKPSELTTVSGGRFTLRFAPGSVGKETEITIQECDSNPLNVQLGPHGTSFGVPVQVTIDYSGTNADVQSSIYDGTVPALYYYNEATDTWEEVPGVAVPGASKYVVTLQHFSEYILGGKGGW